MKKYLFFGGVLLLAGVCHAYTEFSLWSVAIGQAQVMEFTSSERLHCGRRCNAYTVAGQPQKIYLSSDSERLIKEIRGGEVITGHKSPVILLDLATRKIDLMDRDRFLELDIVFEKFPVRGHEDPPLLKFGGDPQGHDFVAPIQRDGREFVACFSSARKNNPRTTVGLPGIIPFFGRQKVVEQEDSFSGTLFLEIFDAADPATALVRLQKEFKDLWLLPSVFDHAAWVQGADMATLVIVDRENPSRGQGGRVIVIQVP